MKAQNNNSVKYQAKQSCKTGVSVSVINKKCYPVCSKKHIKKGKCICLTNK